MSGISLVTDAAKASIQTRLQAAIDLLNAHAAAQFFEAHGAEIISSPYYDSNHDVVGNSTLHLTSQSFNDLYIPTR